MPVWTECTVYDLWLVFSGFNLGVSAKGNQREVNHEVCHAPGFLALQWLLPHHNDISAIYFLLMALLLGQHVKDLPTDVEVILFCLSSSLLCIPIVYKSTSSFSLVSPSFYQIH